MRKKNLLIAITISIILAFLLGLVYFLFFKKPKANSFSELEPPSPEVAVEWSVLQSKPELLEAKEYPEDLPGFLESLVTQESVVFGGDREKTYEILQTQRPGEPGRVLFALYLSFAQLRDSEKYWEKDPLLSFWDREQKRTAFIQTHFAQNLQEKIFPWNSIRAKRSLLWFLENFVQKNPYSLSKERWRAVKQVRKELYSDHEREGFGTETDIWRLEVLKLVYSRELEQMSETERQNFLFSLKERAENPDFWN